jgi:uncharacterized protein
MVKVKWVAAGRNLERIGAFLSSGRAPADSMGLSELDGFLTGIAVGPELIRPSEWLPLVWGCEGPAFLDMDEANAVLGAIMLRYNTILRDIDRRGIIPVFWRDSEGAVVADDWARGFLEAMQLRFRAWEPLFKAEREWLSLMPIMALCRDQEGGSFLDFSPEEEETILAAAPALIPVCVETIAMFWRRGEERRIPMPLSDDRAGESSHISPKTGRNEPCPCGSGKKFKKCCGKRADEPLWREPTAALAV